MNFPKIIFADPQWLWITPAAAALFGALYFLSARARGKHLQQFAEDAYLKDLLPSHSAGRRFIKNALLLIAVTLMTLALSRPQWGALAFERDRGGEDVLFLLDTSRSMLARDVQPDRIERAKIAIRDFTHRQARGRVGLMAFAGSAFLQCPLTFDHEAFDDAIREVNTESIPVPGSDIAKAIYGATKAFEKRDARKIIILLTDGEDLEKEGVKAAEMAAKEGVVIFCVGVGTESGGQLIVPQPEGGAGPVVDDSGEIVTSKLDEETLRKIAAATGGTYRRLESIGSVSNDIGKVIDEGADRKAAMVSKAHGIDRFRWPLTVAILGLIAESLITTRRRQKRPTIAAA